MLWAFRCRETKAATVNDAILESYFPPPTPRVSAAGKSRAPEKEGDDRSQLPLSDVRLAARCSATTRRSDHRSCSDAPFWPPGAILREEGHHGASCQIQRFRRSSISGVWDDRVSPAPSASINKSCIDQQEGNLLIGQMHSGRP